MISNYLRENFLEYFPLFVAIFFSTGVSWFLARKNIPRSFRVAVIGFPQVGKTSLITAIFAYLFRRGVRGASIVPRGEETITRINTHIADMESGVGVSPTRDQDLFAYRADVQARSRLSFFSHKYKLEIGDFPGEQSQSFIESEQPWLHNTNYFQWAMGADAFIFVVDAHKCLENSDNYVVRQKSAFRAAWQRIQEHHIDGSSRLSRKRVVLVYTKADKLLSSIYLDEGLRKEVRQLHSVLDSAFSDLIEYLRRDAVRFHTELTSVTLIHNEERLGVPDVATSILPNWRNFGVG